MEGWRRGHVGWLGARAWSLLLLLFGRQGGFCLIPCLPWTQKKVWEEGQLFPSDIPSVVHSFTGRTHGQPVLKTKNKIKQAFLGA